MDIVRLLLDRGASVDPANRVSQRACLAAPLPRPRGAAVYMPGRIERGRARLSAGWVFGAVRFGVRGVDVQ